MATSIERQTTRDAMTDAARVHIADIDPDLSSVIPGNPYIEASVQLVWPFSSQTAQLSFLLVEQNVSLRETTAQIRITFHGACAKEVAQSKVGIGDILRLDLRGAVAESAQEKLSTPGKKTGFDLHYRRTVNLEVHSDDGRTNVINFVAPDLPILLNGTHSTPETPSRNGSIDISKTRLVSNSTPVLSKKLRVSSNSFPGSLVDPFTEDDGFVPGRGRKRTKFARRSNQWHFADASDEELGPGNEHPANKTTSAVETFGQRVGTAPAPRHDEIPPTHNLASPQDRPHTPRVEAANHQDGKETATAELVIITEQDVVTKPQIGTSVSMQEHASTLEPLPPEADFQIPVELAPPSDEVPVSISTPRLTALTSPGLPLVSPFVSRAHEFSSFSEITSDLDASANVHSRTSTQPGPLPREDSYGFTQTINFTQQPQFMVPETTNPSIEEQNLSFARPNETYPAADVDLDRLQEQIELSNPDHIPDIPPQVIEDEDMYGAPEDLEAAMNSEHIAEIRDKMSSAEVDSLPEGHSSALITEPVVGDIGNHPHRLHTRSIGPAPDPISVDQSLPLVFQERDVFQPYPFQIETISAREGQIAEDDTGRIEQQEQGQPLPTSTGEDLARSLDGTAHIRSSDQDLLDTNVTVAEDALHDQDLRTQLLGKGTTTVSIADDQAPELVAGSAGDLSPVLVHDFGSTLPGVMRQSNQTSYQTLSGQDTDPTFPVQHQSARAVNMMTPEATQTSEILIDEDKTSSHQNHDHFPPTPLASQPRSSEQRTEENSNTRERLSNQTTATASALKSTEKLSNFQGSEGIQSPYFTPEIFSSSVMTGTTIKPTKARNSMQTRLQTSGPTGVYDRTPENEVAEAPMATTETEDILAQDVKQTGSYKGIVTPLEYYVSLNVLEEYYNQHVDVMAVCTADSVVPDRAKSGPKDFFTTIHLTDPSIQQSHTSVTAQIFRPRRSAIPTVDKGDVLLLRRFKVQTKSRKPMLLSTDESAWAVFTTKKSSSTQASGTAGLVGPPIVSGPPVEYGIFENESATRLLRWCRESLSESRPEPSIETLQDNVVEAVGNTRFRKPAPAPLELRRSPRRTRKDANSDVDPSPTSPTFQPETPTTDQPNSRSTLSPTSPQSSRSFRSLRNQPITHKPQDQSTVTSPLKSPPARPRTRAQRSLSFTSPELQQFDENAMPFASMANKNFSSSNSVASSVTQTSGSSKRRRYERRSTSLIHKLRDGTEWVDIEQEEVYSVSESEDDGESINSDDEVVDAQHKEDDDPGDVEAIQVEPQPTEDAEQPEDSNAKHSPREHKATETTPEPHESQSPNKQNRGRPRKEASNLGSEPTPAPSATDNIKSTTKLSGRTTRSQAANQKDT